MGGEEEQPKFVNLPGGRRISYREMGFTKEEASRSLLVLHGLGSSRLAGMPGVEEEVLKQFGVRMVAIDRPGYGQSDGDASQTLQSACKDLEMIMDLLELGEKVWLLGFSCGGAFCWAAARYIPDRVAGMALWCPVGCYWWKGISEPDREAMFAQLSPGSRLLCQYGKNLPFFALRWYVWLFITRMAGAPWLRNCQENLCLPDCEHLQHPEAADLMIRDNIESLTQNGGFGMATDLNIVYRHWGMELAEVGQVLKGTIHIWQGDLDNLVPLKMQQYAKQQLPDLVQLHELKGEGHLSWYCFNNAAHVETLSMLFAEHIDGQPATTH